MGCVELRSRLFLATALALLAISPVTAAKAAPAKPRKIRVVLDSAYAPFSFRSADGRMQGILVDQWAAWEKVSGIKAGIVGRDWARALEDMQRGEFDVIDTIF